MTIIKRGGNKYFFSIAKNASIGLASSALQKKHTPYVTAHKSKYTLRRGKFHKYPKFKPYLPHIAKSHHVGIHNANNGKLKGGRHSTRKNKSL